MDLVFNRAYLIAPERDGSLPTIAVGFTVMPSDFKFGTHPMEDFHYISLGSDSPHRVLTGRLTEDQPDYVVLRDYRAFVESDRDFTYRIELLTPELWHRYHEYIPGYEVLFNQLRTLDDIQRYYIEDLLEPNAVLLPKESAGSSDEVG